MAKNNIFDTVWSSTYQILEESGGKSGPMRIGGVFGSVDKTNGNNRVYPRRVIENQLQEKAGQITAKGMYGNLDHPPESEIKISEASHIVTALHLDMAGNLLGEIQVLDGPYGQQLEAIARAGGQIGFSTRGIGTLENKNGVDVVTEDYQFITVDVVAQPSSSGAFGRVLESQKSGTKKMDPNLLARFKSRITSLRESQSQVRSLNRKSRMALANEADELVSQIETLGESEGVNQVAAVGAISDLKAIAARMRESRETTPSGRLSAAGVVIESLTGKLGSAHKDIRRLALENAKLKASTRTAKRTAALTMESLKRTTRRLQLACALGEKLLQKRTTTKGPSAKRNESKSPQLRSAVNRIIERKDYLGPMRKRLLNCNSMGALREMVRELDDFYGASPSNRLFESIRSSKATRGAENFPATRNTSSSSLTESQRRDVSLLDTIENHQRAHATRR